MSRVKSWSSPHEAPAVRLGSKAMLAESGPNPLVAPTSSATPSRDVKPYSHSRAALKAFKVEDAVRWAGAATSISSSPDPERSMSVTLWPISGSGIADRGGLADDAAPLSRIPTHQHRGQTPSFRRRKPIPAAG